jgi:uncharacterized membrane protein YbhN (UPF0104 family)
MVKLPRTGISARPRCALWASAADFRFYLWACAFAKRRHLTIKGQRLVLPSWRFALLQMAVSAANWMAMGAIIWLLLGRT